MTCPKCSENEAGSLPYHRFPVNLITDSSHSHLVEERPARDP